MIKAKPSSTAEKMDSAEYLLEELELHEGDTFWSKFSVKSTGIASDKKIKYNVEQAKEESVFFLRSLEASQNRATYRHLVDGDEEGPLDVLDMLPEERVAHEKKEAADAEVVNSDYEENQVKPGKKRKAVRRDTEAEAASRKKFHEKRSLVVKNPGSLREQEPGAAPTPTPTPTPRPMSATSALDQIMAASKESTNDFKQIVDGRERKKQAKEVGVFVWNVLRKQISYMTPEGYQTGQSAIEENGLQVSADLVFATDTMVETLSLLLKPDLRSRFEKQMETVRG